MWIQIASTTDCPPGKCCEKVAGERIVALFNVAGEIYALDGICPHQGGPLGQGNLNGCLVTCPWHGWQFDVRDGQHQATESLQHATIPVRVDGDAILIELDG